MNSSLNAAPSPAPARFGRRFWPLFLLGLPGVASLPLMLVPMLRDQPLPPGMPPLPLPALVALSLVNPLLLLAGATALGAWLAPKTGLVSLTVDRSVTGAAVWPRLRAQAPLAIGAGLLVGVAMVALDAAFQPHLGAAWAQAAARAEAAAAGPGALVSALLYGGITEEILLRWGFVPLLALAGWRLFRRRHPAPGAGVMWAAIVLAALMFGVAHLPAVAALAPLTELLMARTVALNAVGGVVFGWIFWRRSLEAAMVAHAFTHVGIALLRLAGLA